MRISFVVHVRNTLGRKAEVVLEPYGDVVALEPNEGVDIKAEGPDASEGRDGGFLQVDIEEGAIVVWGWSRGHFEIDRASKRLHK
ncbi:hypothetical protein [Corallococcus terminator]|uniref:hypothetical protein n=1 Tax=Corallococcus terminator TaxID=2316733 RepID=UPI0011C35C34|nr:hypothetical protein [Corallococcus terminator]